MVGGIIFIVLMILLVIWSACTLEKRKVETKDGLISFQEEKDSFISENGISSLAKELNYTDYLYSSKSHIFRGHNVCFFIDQVSRKIGVFSNHGLREAVPFSKVIGCEIYTDSKVTGGIGRAVVGGMIAGDVGAIVGAMTAPSSIMSYKVVVYVNDALDPMIEIPLVEEKKSTKNTDYTDAVRFAENVNAAIKAIVYQNGKA